MKNKVCTVLLFMLLATPVFSAQEEAADIGTEPIVQTETLQEEDVSAEPQENIIPAVPSEKYETPYKEPVSKRKIVKKFLLAMLGVVFSSFVIYFGLNVYNRFREGIGGGSSYNREEEGQLSAPSDLTDAIKSFLNNTKWN